MAYLSSIYRAAVLHAAANPLPRCSSQQDKFVTCNTVGGGIGYVCDGADGYPTSAAACGGTRAHHRPPGTAAAAAAAAAAARPPPAAVAAHHPAAAARGGARARARSRAGQSQPPELAEDPERV